MNGLLHRGSHFPYLVWDILPELTRPYGVRCAQACVSGSERGIFGDRFLQGTDAFVEPGLAVLNL